MRMRRHISDCEYNGDESTMTKRLAPSDAFNEKKHRNDFESQIIGRKIASSEDQRPIGATEQPPDISATWQWKDVVWANVVRIGLLHIFAIWGVLVLPELKWPTLVFGLIWLSLSGLSVTMGAHRLWCHRSYKAKLPLRIGLMLANCIASQNDLYVWVRDHRVHHKYSDTDADPHNISRGLFFSHVGWLLLKKHPDVIKFGNRIDCSDVLADPVVRFQKKYYAWLVIIFAFLIPTCLPLLWGESLKVAFLVPTCLRIVASLHFTWSVNSLAHYFGDKPFDSEMKPTETTLVSMWAVGEGFHNFHHVFPFDYACSELGWYMNFSTLVIDLMAAIGQAYDRRSVSKETILKKKLATGDGTRLPASIKEIRTLGKPNGDTVKG